jgi:hypothetical protein
VCVETTGSSIDLDYGDRRRYAQFSGPTSGATPAVTKSKISAGRNVLESRTLYEVKCDVGCNLGRNKKREQTARRASSALALREAS